MEQTECIKKLRFNQFQLTWTLTMVPNHQIILRYMAVQDIPPVWLSTPSSSCHSRWMAGVIPERHALSCPCCVPGLDYTKVSVNSYV